ncbi:kinetochore protein Spc25-like isoform X2 [Xenia sp. Carnegie-2017]|uniref:kinetochore protein Spc25-like isoform X1 n=1 Tax=Xenia sp. Carnegie-2017 TaxID=2897299 RepID=UPI001F043902|nr:kinetochore protein Spc25-like isoform X1 [Xenia sp. Carnegie-2017]XP_046846041.1 kinetochore protein Spc25-like isoform X2 [Xenia sp. Carnegie-2017]
MEQNNSQQKRQEELDVFICKLDQIEEKFLNEWTGETLHNLNKLSHENVEANFESRKARIEEINNKILQDRAKVEQICSAKKEQEATLVSVNKEFEKLTVQTKELSEKRVLKEKHLNDSKQQNIQEQQACRKASEKMQLKMNQFSKGLTLFQKYLGFTFEKIEKDLLKFIFKFINPDDPEAPYSFTVHVDEITGVYSVTDCSPMIDQLDDFVGKLNKTNDFSLFIVRIRQSFKQMACKV